MSNKKSSNPAFDFWLTATVLGGIIGYSAVSTNPPSAIIGVGVAAKLGVCAAPLIVAGFTIAPTIIVASTVVGAVVVGGALVHGVRKVTECIDNNNDSPPMNCCSCPQASQSIATKKTL